MTKICPECSTQVATKVQLKQHRAAKHGLKVAKPPAIKVAYGGRASNRGLAPAIHARVSDIRNGQTSWKFPDLLMTKLGKTPTGRAWAMTALHPCGKGELISPYLGDLVGMPDTMTGAVVNPCYPGESYINFDTTLFSTPPTDLSGTWGIDIVVPPIPEIDYMYRLRYDTTGVVSRWKVVRLPNMELPVFNDSVTGNKSYTVTTRGTTFASLGYGKTRAIGVGHTFELDASATNNQGRVVAAQIEGQWTFEDFTTSTIVPQEVQAVTGVGPPVTTAVVLGLDSGINTSGGVCKLAVLSVPTDPQTLVAACPSSYQADAKFGAYAVTKFASPLLGYQFKGTGNDYSIQVGELPQDDDETAGVPASAFGITTGGYNSEIPVLNNIEAFATGSNYGDVSIGVPLGSDTDANQIHPWVSMPSDMMTNVVMFRNLALGTVSTISSNSVVHVKSRNYFECIPNAQNPATTPFTHSPAQYDYPALDAVITVGKQLSDAYPASANDLGEMIGTIWDGVKEIAEPIAKEIGGLGIPVVSGIAKEIGSSLHSNADALNNKMQQMRHFANGTHLRSLLGAAAGY